VNQPKTPGNSNLNELDCTFSVLISNFWIPCSAKLFTLSCARKVHGLSILNCLSKLVGQSRNMCLNIEITDSTCNFFTLLSLVVDKVLGRTWSNNIHFEHDRALA
jgi:hypothetical protein